MQSLNINLKIFLSKLEDPEKYGENITKITVRKISFLRITEKGYYNGGQIGHTCLVWKNSCQHPGETRQTHPLRPKLWRTKTTSRTWFFSALVAVATVGVREYQKARSEAI